MEIVLIIGAVATLLIGVLAQLRLSRCSEIECSDCLKIKRQINDITQINEINRDKDSAVELK